MCDCIKCMLSCRVPTVLVPVLRIMRASRQELTTRDEYLATRFTKLSASGHDLTPLTQSEVSPSVRLAPATSFDRAGRWQPQSVDTVLTSSAIGIPDCISIAKRVTLGETTWQFVHWPRPPAGEEALLGAPPENKKTRVLLHF